MYENKKQNQHANRTGANRGAGRRKGKSGKKNKEFKSKEAKFDAEANRGQTKASNDPTWYGADSPLMHNAANLSFNNMAGVSFNWGDVQSLIPNVPGTNFYNSITSESQLTGLAVMEYIPMPGILNDWTSPFNVAIRDIYSWIRKSQSGAKNYNAADLGHYVMAYDSALIFYAWMVRVYGTLRMVVQRNRYTPKAVLAAMGVDYDDLIIKAAQFRFYINSFAARLSAMKMPAVFDLFKRHMWLTSNIFADAPVQTAQIIVPNPSHIWKFEIDDASATLTPARLGAVGTADNERGVNRLDNLWKYEDIVSNAEVFLNILLNNEDFNIMSGDIMKAYEGNVVALSFIGEDYVLTPVFDPEFNLQFHNATFFTVWDDTIKTWTIYEDTSETTNVGALVTNIYGPLSVSDNPTLAADMSANPYLVSKKIIDIPFEQPTSKDVAIATRFALAGEITDHDTTNGLLASTNMDITEYGTEIPTRLTGYALDAVTGGLTRAMRLIGNQPDTSRVSIDDYTKFANAPIWPSYLFVSIESNPTDPGQSIRLTSTTNRMGVQTVSWMGDFDHFALLDKATLRNIHTAALFGLYGLVK